MNGHHKPRRTPARPHRVSLVGRCTLPTTLLLAGLLALVLAISALAAGCGSNTKAGTSTSAVSTTFIATTEQVITTAAAVFPVNVKDSDGTSLTFNAAAKRIVAVSPGVTEALFALGVGDRVVGVTKIDNYPPEAANVTSRVDYFQPSTEALVALSPDLVIGDEGNRDALKPVRAEGIPVMIFAPKTVEDIYSQIIVLGAVTGTTAKADEVVAGIKAQIKTATDAAGAANAKPTVFYALDNTLWTCGPGSFVDGLLTLANCVNIGATSRPAGTADAYYQITPEQLVAADPDIVLLPSSSGYKNADEFTQDSRFTGLKAVKNGHVYLFDDTTLTRQGPRIGDGIESLVKTIHPGAL